VLFVIGTVILLLLYVLSKEDSMVLFDSNRHYGLVIGDQKILDKLIEEGKTKKANEFNREMYAKYDRINLFYDYNNARLYVYEGDIDLAKMTLNTYLIQIDNCKYFKTEHHDKNIINYCIKTVDDANKLQYKLNGN
jgi:hypothetical protein